MRKHNNQELFWRLTERVSFARRGKTLPIYTTPTLPPDSRALARTAPIGPGSILIRLNTSQALFCRNAGCKLPGGYIWLNCSTVSPVRNRHRGGQRFRAGRRSGAQVPPGFRPPRYGAGVRGRVPPLSSLSSFWFLVVSFLVPQNFAFKTQRAQMGPRLLRENGNPPHTFTV